MATVYVADRDDAIRKTLAHHLRQRGHDVLEFSSGAELYAETMAGEPDLIVLETDLADMDGFQVFARLRRKRPDAPFPVIFVTEFEHPRVARVLKQRGALGYVGKNRSPEQLADAVQAFLPHDDPLYQRKLPAALAWLQSRGKTGRLEIESEDERGYVLLHRGRVLEASWRGLRGEEALTFLGEGLPEASFHFAEGLDETDVGDEVLMPAEPHAEQDEAVVGTVSAVESDIARELADESDDPRFAAMPSSIAPVPPSTTLASSTEPPSHVPLVRELAKPQRSGAVAAAHDLKRRHGRLPGGGGGRRVALGIAAGVVLLLLGAVSAALLFPGSVPPGLAAILDDLGVPAEREVTEPAPQLARAEDATETPGRAERVNAAEDAATPAEAPDLAAPAADDSAAERLALLTRTDPTSPVVDQAGERAAAQAPQETDASPPAEGEATDGRAEPEPSTRAEEPTPPPPPPPAAEPPRVVRSEPPPAPERRTAETETTELAAARTRAADDAPPETPTERRVAPAPAAAEERPSTPRRTARRAPPPAPPPAPAAELVQRPVLLQRPQPYYPPELRTEGVGGTVILRIRVGANGRAQQVDVQRSSGHEALDGAAVAAVGTFLWEPARDVRGPTETWITQAVTFRP